MHKVELCILISFCLFICQVYARRHISKEERNLRDLNLVKGEHEGVFVATYVGDYFLAIRDGRVEVVKDFRNANFFTVDLPKRKKFFKRNFFFDYSKEGFLFEPWVNGKKMILTYNSIGEDINIEIPIDSAVKTKSNLTIFRNVIAENAKKPVFEIVSAQTQKCFELDPNTNLVSLQHCANGANDLQTFRFLTYNEVLENNANKNGNTAFSMPEYTARTRVPSVTLVVANISGVLYKQ